VPKFIKPAFPQGQRTQRTQGQRVTLRKKPEGVNRMDASDRIRRNQQSRIAAPVFPSFTATWSSGATTMTSVTGTPRIGSYANATGIPSNTIITNVSGTTVTLSAATTAAQATATAVVMTPTGASLTSFRTYEEKYNVEGGVSYLSYDTGIPVYASTIGSFGCEGSN
jgi:hypothetical protein